MTQLRDPEHEEPLLRIAGAISDDERTDWEAEKRLNPGLSETLERLRLVESLVRAAHAPLPDRDEPLDASSSPTEAHAPGRGTAAGRAAAVAAAPAIHAWGPLRVLELVGEGGFSWVYRAHDPTLDCDVALKIWRPETGRTRDELLAEARRLAHVRHDNVLVVHGADCFDGRAGMWTDLLRGETLEQRLQHHGRFGARETAAIGIEVCRALCAMHAVGFVHRDVKTFNVMRTDQGRCVVMDFGCVGELAPGGDAVRTTSIHGTPATMAPEQLFGGPIGPAADLYGLGVMLYRLVSGAYPIEAGTYGDLVARHRDRAFVPLLDRRPDLPASFVHVVETAMDPDPGKRFASAGAMEQALHEVVVEAERAAGPERAAPSVVPPAPAPAPRRWWLRTRWQLAAAAVLLVAAVPYVVTQWPSRRSAATDRGAPGAAGDAAATSSQSLGPGAQPSGESAPAPPVAIAPVLEVKLALFRVTADGDERLIPGARVEPGDALFLEIRSPQALYVYAFNEDAAGEAYVLFPAAGLDETNPLAPNMEHRLPGTTGGLRASWQITSAGGRERVLVVASRKPLAEVEAEISGLPKPEEGAPVRYHRASDATVARLRGLGGLVTGPPRKSPGSAWQHLSGIAQTIPAGAMTVRDPFVWQIELENPAK